MLEGLVIDHVGIAVKSIEKALQLWNDGLGAKTGHRELSLIHI